MFCFKKSSLKPEEDPPTRQGPACLMQLPKLKLSGVTELASYPSPALHSVFGPGANSKAPVPRPLKFVGTNQKVARLASVPPLAAPDPSRPPLNVYPFL